MKIYIDESGLFANPNNNDELVCCVGGLAIPDKQRRAIVKGYNKLLKKWGKKVGSEMKGRDLDEDKFIQLVNMLTSYEVMFNAVLIDCADQVDDEIANHKNEQGQKIIAPITKYYHETLIEELHENCCKLQKIPNQLYLQAICMTELVTNIVQLTTLRYSLCRPEALGSFGWYIDAKNTVITNYEEWWSTLVAGFVQSKFLNKRFIQLEEGNYGAFKRYEQDGGNVPEHLAGRIDCPDGEFDSCDIGLIMKEDMNFVDSKSDICVQLADLLVSCLARSLKGNFGRKGWAAFPRIMFQQVELAALPMVTISSLANGQKSYHACLQYINNNARAIYD